MFCPYKSVIKKDKKDLVVYLGEVLEIPFKVHLYNLVVKKMKRMSKRRLSTVSHDPATIFFGHFLLKQIQTLKKCMQSLCNQEESIFFLHLAIF